MAIYLPITDEIPLVENSAVGAEEGVGVQSSRGVGQGADVENLRGKKIMQTPGTNITGEKYFLPKPMSLWLFV